MGRDGAADHRGSQFLIRRNRYALAAFAAPQPIEIGGIDNAFRREDIALDQLVGQGDVDDRSEEHTSELQSLMSISYAVFCLHKTNTPHNHRQRITDTYQYYQSTT